MKSFCNYIKSIVLGIWNLLLGMKITMLNFLRPKITEQYPENRGKQVMFERFRGSLTMVHNDKNEHGCTACGICQMNCPNGTIKIVSSMIEDAETGKKKKVLDKYLYDIGTCIFCDMCVSSCPQQAIAWSTEFEHAVFNRFKLVKQLNNEGSTLKVKEKSAPKTEVA